MNGLFRRSITNLNLFSLQKVLDVKNFASSLSSNLTHNTTGSIQPVAKLSQLNMSAHDHNKVFTHNSSIAITSQPNTLLLKCTYEKDITIYMDAFLNLVHGFFGPEYRDFLVESKKCGLLPGGGHCLFNYKNKHSDAIFYYGSVSLREFLMAKFL